MLFVYVIPPELSKGFCFDGPKPIQFNNVDWFSAEHLAYQEKADIHRLLIDFIKGKPYYRPGDWYLVLATREEPIETFTIEPEVVPTKDRLVPRYTD